MNPPPNGESNICGVVFGDHGAISHVPLFKSVINVVLIDGKRPSHDFSFPRITYKVYQFLVELPSPKHTEMRPMNPPP